MTPNRYLLATAAALTLQGSLLAAMAQEPQPMMQSGQVTTAVSLSLAKAVNAAPAHPEPAPQPEAKPEPKPKPQPKPEPKPQPKPKPKPEPQPQPEPKPKPKPEPKPQPKPVPKAESKPASDAARPVAARQGAQDLPDLVTQPAFRAPPSPPRYPKVARKRGQQGVALVEVWLDELGEQVKLELLQSSGHTSLDRAALAAVKQWQFAPQIHGSAPRASRVRIPVRFNLN